jgi:hypothetical protein
VTRAAGLSRPRGLLRERAPLSATLHWRGWERKATGSLQWGMG